MISIQLSEQILAQLVVRNLDERVKRELKQRAVKNGRSLEGEVREILSQSVEGDRGKTSKASARFGTRLAEIFAGKVPGDFQIPGFRDEPVRPVKLRK